MPTKKITIATKPKLNWLVLANSRLLLGQAVRKQPATAIGDGYRAAGRQAAHFIAVAITARTGAVRLVDLHSQEAERRLLGNHEHRVATVQIEVRRMPDFFLLPFCCSYFKRVFFARMRI